MAERRTLGKARVYIVDDHPVVRNGITMLINKEPDLEVCGEAEDAQTAISNIAAQKPDIAIVDISLKGMSGLELIKHVRARDESLPLLVLSMHDESLYAERVLRAGAMGYIMKQEAPERIVAAIRRVLAGDIYLSPAMSSRILQRFVGARAEADESPLKQLSDRELEVFEYIGRGHGTRQIAEALHLSVKTIESHRENIKNKLNLRTGMELVQHAIRWVQSESR